MFPPCHIEPAKGDFASNKVYCSKDDNWRDWGAPAPGAGARTDLDAVRARLDEGATLTDISQEYFGVFVRYHRGLALYRTLNHVPTGREDMTIRWLWGPTGSGKTRAVRRMTEHLGLNAFWLQTSPTGTWWNGYDGQPIVVMDDLRAGWMPHGVSLRVFQRAPYRVPYHGGSANLECAHMFVTTNDPPHMLYADDPANALLRRIRDFAYVYECLDDIVYIRNTPNVC